jgi:acetyl esterase/lipase
MRDTLRIRYCVLILTMCACWTAHAQTEIRLWPGAAPGALGTDPDRDTPRMFAYLPDSAKRTGCAMVICPGGGYHNIEPFRDDANGAIWFSQHGIACFVLRYRIGTEGYRYPEITADARRAMRLVRSRAKEWSIDTARIGIYGVSAGGHLAAVTSNYFDSGNPGASDPIDRLGCRPRFSLLLMPVISMDARWTYQPGVPNFLGNNPSQSLIDSFSMEKHITSKTPPTFLAHDYDDGLVTYLNSIMYRDSCIAHGIGVKFLRVYNCGHGITTNGCPGWADTAMVWLKSIGMLNRTTSLSGRAPGACHGTSLHADGVESSSSVAYDIRGSRIPRAVFAGSMRRGVAVVRGRLVLYH